jgi:hypothetical protein
MNNVRYITSTHIGTWAQDKNSRFTLLPQNDEPILWDFGSAARHHQLHCPWLGERSRAGIPSMRGAMTPEMGRAEDVAKKIRIELEMRGLHKEPLGVDIIEPDVMIALQREGISIVNGHALMCEAREIKTEDEITLLNMAAMMVDAAYYDLYRAMKPGMRENEAVALVAERLYDLGSEYVEGVNAISGERCSPHPHLFSDRALRPGDPVYYDILHSYMGYRTCYYRTFAVGSAPRALVDAYKRCRDYLDASIELIRPGRLTSEVASVWPKAQEFGFPNEEAAFALQMGHGIGLAIWERPMISRLVSLEHPHEIKPGWSSRSKRSGRRRWLERCAYRRRNRRHEDWSRGDYAIPGRGAAGRRRAVRHRRWARCLSSARRKRRPNPQVVEMIAAAARAEATRESRADSGQCGQ